MTFEKLGLSAEVLKAVAEAGYETPTPIQEKAIPIVLMGRDVLGCAQTGTGKTAGFTLPMVDILAEGRARARMPRSLILTPTRELAAQIADNFKIYGKYSSLNMALLIGGSSFTDQEKALDKGVDVLIATPGRLIDLFERGKIIMADVKILVIDEADRMMDMGFIPDVEKIVSKLPVIRQTLFFSATMPPAIRRLADKFLINPKEVSVDPPSSTATTVTQVLIKVNGGPKEKRAALRAAMRRENMDSALIFCNRKKDVDTLLKSLTTHGFKAAALHGDMAQPVRTETLATFKSGKNTILVCSDVAARGLDIPAVSHVFCFDVPINAEDYVHRIGRTGRAGRSGRAITFATKADAKHLAQVQKLIGDKLKTEDDPAQAPKTEAATAQEAPAQEALAEAPRADTTSAADASATTDKPKTGRRRGRGKKADAKAPAKAQEKAPAKAPAKSPVKSSAKTAEKKPGKGNKSDKNDAADRVFGDHVPDFIRRQSNIA